MNNMKFSISKHSDSIIGICDGIITGYDNKGYYILSSNFITEYDKYLADVDNNIYPILDMIEIEISREQTMMPYYYIDGSNKHTCVKLDSIFNVGDKLYGCYEIYKYLKNE